MIAKKPTEFPTTQLNLLDFPTSAGDLISAAMALGAGAVCGWSESERALVASIPAQSPDTSRDVLSAIRQAEDPIGEAFCRLYSAETRRPLGATYTPRPIVEAMVAWAKSHGRPSRIVDPGVGSARFLVHAGRAFPESELIGIEVDPLAAIVARGHLAGAGLGARAKIILGDFRDLTLPPSDGPTLFIGNPPYVRHHLITEPWKRWLVANGSKHGIQASQLAGLHAHFFLATANLARSGDFGAFITASEWLDVNYGRLIRELLLGPLGVQNITVIEPTATPFPDAATTAVITTFEVGTREARIGLNRAVSLARLNALSPDRWVPRQRLENAARWTPLTRAATSKPLGYVELGELCRVHRGQVTGANEVWIAGAHSAGLPERLLFPTVTKARELFAARPTIHESASLKRVIDLPVDLDTLSPDEAHRVDLFLSYARSRGADGGYVARNRRAWWSVGLREPAPILASYMARRPPIFVRNLAGARHINIAHGLYPRVALCESQLRALACILSRSVSMDEGRTYAGGLTKFEPREMERLLVPAPENLVAEAVVE